MNIKLEFSVDEVNCILNALANMPYRDVAGLIGKIHAEGERQLSSAKEE